jgi:hypothetical protein
VQGLVGGAPEALQLSQASLAAQRPDRTVDYEQGAPLDEDRDGDRLVAVRLERLEFVELEGAGETRRGQPVGLEIGGMPGQPGEAALNGAPGNPKDPGGLAHADAGDHQVEAGGVDGRLLLTAVGAEGLTREPPAADAAAEARHGVATAEGMIEPVADEESGRGIAVGPAVGVGTADRNEHASLHAGGEAR